MHGQGGDYKQTIITVPIGNLAMVGGMAKRHLELVGSEENQHFYACRDKSTLRTYVNTPATAKLAIAE